MQTKNEMPCLFLFSVIDYWSIKLRLLGSFFTELSLLKAVKMFTLLAFVLCVFAADFAGCSIIERRSTYDLCEGDVCLTGSNKTCLSLPVSVRIRGHYPGCYPNDLICRKVKTISIDVSHMEEHESYNDHGKF